MVGENKAGLASDVDVDIVEQATRHGDHEPTAITANMLVMLPGSFEVRSAVPKIESHDDALGL